MNLIFTGARILDPQNHRDGNFDLLIINGKISKIEKMIRHPENCQKVQANGLWIMPGFVDVHAHLREPGGEDSETIESGSRAAARGGVTSLLAMANTNPPIDNPQTVRFVVKRAKEKAVTRIYPIGAVTKGLEGKELADIPGLVKAGCKAVSDDGHEIMNSRLLRRALEYTKSLEIPLIEHCEDQNLSLNGVMNEGVLSLKLGLRGIPSEAESVMVSRNIYLSQLTGAPIHCAHISTKDSVDIIREAKKKKIPVSSEACPHHFSLTEEAIQRYNTHAKMNPPLRSREDLAALQEGLADGTIDMIASDHAPHEPLSKEKEFAKAPFGIIGLETLFALTYNELVLKEILSPLLAVEKLTSRPAETFGLDAGNLTPGSPADFVLFDPNQSWTANKFISKSGNSPFIGQTFKGKILSTYVRGHKVYDSSLQDFLISP